MLRGVEILNLRGIRQGKLEELAPLSVLVGPNGSGKSTLLDALLMGADPSPGEALGRVVQRRPGLDDGARWIRHGASDRVVPEVVVHADGVDRSVSLPVPSTGYGHFAHRAEQTLGERGHAGPYTHLAVTAGDMNLGLVSFAYDGDYELTGPTAPQPVVRFVRLIDSGQSFLSAPVTRRYTELMRQGQLQLAKDLIVALVPTAEDLRVGVDDGGRPVLHVLYKGSQGSTPLALAGDGIKLAVRAGLELAIEGGGLALLEEPETHLHPRAVWIIAQSIVAAVRRDVQVVLTTHSLDLLDALLAEMADDVRRLAVFRTRLDDGNLVVSRIAGEDVQQARAVLHEDSR